MPTRSSLICSVCMKHSCKSRKKNLYVDDYMQHIKWLSDDLALIEYTLSDEELIVHVLNGIGFEFKELCAAIRALDTLISFEKLHDKILDQKTSLHHDSTSKSFTLVTAQYTQKRTLGTFTSFSLNHMSSSRNRSQGFTKVT